MHFFRSKVDSGAKTHDLFGELALLFHCLKLDEILVVYLLKGTEV